MSDTSKLKNVKFELQTFNSFGTFSFKFSEEIYRKYAALKKRKFKFILSPCDKMIMFDVILDTKRKLKKPTPWIRTHKNNLALNCEKFIEKSYKRFVES